MALFHQINKCVVNNKNRSYLIVILIFALVIVGVLYVSQSKKTDYLARGKKSYEIHCSNCHGINGEGLQLLIPPLTDPKWINNDSIVCIIKNGMDGEIVVNNKNYSGRMTSNAKIANDEIADLVSYIRHDFTKKPQRITIKEVTSRILICN
jgi:mono/diheme cytochrome c family protein